MKALPPQRHRGPDASLLNLLGRGTPAAVAANPPLKPPASLSRRPRPGRAKLPASREVMDLRGKTVLVTGGTGSFGNHIVHRLLKSEVGEIRVFSRDEKKQYDMRKNYGANPKLRFFIGDIRDGARLDEAMSGVDIAYQAAALKHVSVCETAPFEAIKTNVIGVENVIRSALSHRIKKLICLSTDKAVKPVNVMGMTKALQERLVIAANHSPANQGTICSVVRYGNVLLSRGSAIPFFRSQVARGEQITITDEAMTRFLLTLGDAIELVFFATLHSVGGETYVKKAPAVGIVQLARVLSEEKGQPFSYRVIGKLPGEKLHEILITEEELERTVDRGDYFVIHPHWSPGRYKELTTEYASQDEVISDDTQIKRLLAAADELARIVDIEDGEFSRI